jgi:cation:H+ antiporter
MVDILHFLAGLLLLAVGGELLVRGASRLALAIGISPLVVGLTVVAFGTSSPELAVSVRAGLTGNPDIAAGNVVGSNILNVLLILGVAALLTPLVVNRQLVRREVPLMIAASVLAWLFALDGRFGFAEGLALLAGLVGYTVYAIWQSRREVAAAALATGAAALPAPAPGTWYFQVALIAAGLALLVTGAGLLVGAAISLARGLGVSELVIGLTIVAAGTSMPEVVTSIIAAVRGERDIAVGNVVGSNLFNLLGILGVATLVTPGGISAAPALVHFDLPVMIAVAIACLPIFFTGHLIARWEGVVFLAYYAAYTAFLILDATAHEALPAFSGMMLSFVLPITVLTLAVLAARALRAQHGGSAA